MRKQQVAKAAPLTGAFFLVLFSFGACTTTTIVEDLPDGAFTTKDGAGPGTGSDTGTVTGDDDSGTIAGDSGTLTRDSGTLPRPHIDASVGDDGSVFGDDGSSSSCPGPAPTAADLDQPDGAPGWNPPNPINATACSVSDFQKFDSNLNNPSLATWNDLVTGLSASCSSCILSQESSTHWQLVVTDSTGQNGFLNWGACYAVAPHGSTACGQAVQYLNFCTDISCNGCPDSQFQSCTQAKATVDACDANFGQALTNDCDQTYAQALDDACGTAVNAAAVLCGHGEPDGGTLPP